MQIDESTSASDFGAHRMLSQADRVPEEFLPGFELPQIERAPVLGIFHPSLGKCAPDCTCLNGQAAFIKHVGLAARAKTESSDLGSDCSALITHDFAGVLGEETLLESQYLEAKRQIGIKDHFLAVLAHELRTPLQAIMAWAEILASGPLAPDELAQGLAVIRTSAISQSRIIEDLLDMSRMATGKLRLELQPVDLAAVIELTVDMLKPQAGLRKVLVYTALAGCSVMAEGDPVRLHQIFGNLLSNAIKFTPPGGSIHLHLESTPSNLTFRIADNGQGIDPAFLPHVFDRFLRGDSSTTRRCDGLGLGLSIVKHLVELHGGSIQVASEGLSKGATFTVTLPATTPPVLPAVSTRVSFIPIRYRDIAVATSRRPMAAKNWAVASR
jgi:signal transduction histidine kinase